MKINYEVKNFKTHLGRGTSSPGYLVKDLLLGKYYYAKAKANANNASTTNKSHPDIVHYLYSKHFQDRIRAMAHAGKLDRNYDCKYCNKNKLVFGENSEEIINSLAKFGAIKIPEIIAQALKDILGYDDAQVSQAFSQFKGKDYALLSYLYHLDKTKFQHAYRLRAIIRKKTLKNYKELVNGKDVDSLTYKDIKEDIDKVTKAYHNMVVGCPACQGFGYLDVGHKNPSGKAIKIVSLLYIRYQNDPNAFVTYDDLWDDFFGLGVFPQIAKRPTSTWADTNIVKSDIIGEDEELIMANQFADFTNAIGRGLKAAVARVRRLIENKGEKETDPNLITFEQGLTFYDKLIDTVRVDTGTLKNALRSEQQRLRTRLTTEWNKDTSTEILRNGRIEHIIPETFLWIAGATRIQRAGKPGYHKRHGEYKFHKSTPTPKRNKFLVYAAFLSDLGKYSFERYPWSTTGETVSSIARQVFTPEQQKLLKVFPQLVEV